MARLFGREWSRGELARRVGDVSQVAGVRASVLADGLEAGTQVVDVWTGSGLRFSVVPSRGMDISAASFGAIPLAWRSAQGDRNPAHYDPAGLGWLRSFPGGLVTTCGLSWMGAPCQDEGVELGLHGRASNTAATNVTWDANWDGDECILSVGGRVRETVVFGTNLELRRRIWCRVGESVIHIDDTVENLGWASSPHMMLYHVNLGFPIVDAGSSLEAPSEVVEPRDEDARGVLASYGVCEAPEQGYTEKVYFHRMRADADGWVRARLVSPVVGAGVEVRYRQAELPEFVHWKMMACGEYVVGLEPANARVMGRPTEREAGRLRHLAPGEVVDYRVEIAVV